MALFLALQVGTGAARSAWRFDLDLKLAAFGLWVATASSGAIMSHFSQKASISLLGPGVFQAKCATGRTELATSKPAHTASLLESPRSTPYADYLT